MSGPPAADRRARSRRLMLVQLGFLVPVLVAVSVLHVSGTTLVVIHIVRIAVVLLVVLIAGRIRSRGDRGDPRREI